MREGTANFTDILLAILLPPLGVFRKFGWHVEFWICLLLTIWGYFPGIIYATYVITFRFHFHFHPLFSALLSFLSSPDQPRSPNPLNVVSSDQSRSPNPLDAVSPKPLDADSKANAFHVLAPPSVVCTSSSKKPCYDVFINHRGKDVKRKLASTIYNTLDIMGLQAFLDEQELEVGDSFPEAIEEAMRSASVHIAIFSPTYAESPWCLEELWFMLQINVTIIPVFYNVQPTDLRYAMKGIYVDAFQQHQTKRRYNVEKIEEWKKALSSASYMSGFIVDGDKCDEGKLLREIVETALHKMRKVPLKVATYPVGLEEAIQDFEREVGSSSWRGNVHIVGIVGMGGIGKTTLAKELYNRKRSPMIRSSFLSDVRHAASTHNLHNLQKNLLRDLRIQHPKFHDVHQGMGMLERHLRCMSVLIVLDDVDHEDQIEALLPEETMQNLGRGSYIIVTAREKKVLKNWGISIYHMKLLDHSNARQLFCRHAFLQPFSQRGFEHLAQNSQNFQDLIERFLKACNGLPLSLKVLGAMLNGESEVFWEAQLHKISRILPKEITERLQLSYDALDSEVQEMFLDAACFFTGGQKSLVVAIWDGSGSYGSRWSGEVGWVTLVNKCLIGLDENGRIEMHDHLRDLGRQIAKDVSPTRIWKEGQISIQEGRTAIRGIVAATAPSRSSILNVDTYYQLPLELSMEKLRPSLRELQLFAGKGNEFREELLASSRDLAWLRLWDFDGANLPLWLSLANLRVLELYKAKNLEELWQDNVEPPLQLRELIIHRTGKTCFRGLPRSIGRLGHLKKIVLDGVVGRRMSSLPEEFCQLRSLEFLELSSFQVLSSLPDDFGKLRNLRSLKLDRVQLTALPHSFKQLTVLQSLSIIDSKSFMFTSDMLDVLQFTTELQFLEIVDCPQVEELPHLTTQVSLRELRLIRNSTKGLPHNIGQLTKLETLGIGRDNLTTLPESFGALSCLTSLDIMNCQMESLPRVLGCLSNLQSLGIYYTPVVEVILNLKSLKFLELTVTQVCRISISDNCCPSLETLLLLANDHLTEIETLPGNIRTIVVGNCKKLKNMRGISGLVNLEKLEVDRCPDLEELPCPEYMHSVGHILKVSACPLLKDYDDHVEDGDDDDEDYDYDEDNDDDDEDYVNDNDEDSNDDDCG